MDHAELSALPPLVDVPTAARALGIGRGLAYDLVRSGSWPTPVLRMGKLIRIPSAPLIHLLHGAAPALADEAPESRAARHPSTGSIPS